MKKSYYVIVFVTTSGKKEASRISLSLLDRRLVACVNIIGNIDSYFWWQSKKERVKEYLLIAKTKRSLLKELIKTVKSLHSYEVPEIIAFPVMGGFKPYLDWIREVVK
jgi:periplasmic divalent cation tolerance protein